MDVVAMVMPVPIVPMSLVIMIVMVMVMTGVMFVWMIAAHDALTA